MDFHIHIPHYRANFAVMSTSKSLVEDFIFENQRRISILPGNLGPTVLTDLLHSGLDAQYNKQNLNQKDPTSWVDVNGKSCTPATVPLLEVVKYYVRWMCSEAYIYLYIIVLAVDIYLLFINRTINQSIIYRAMLLTNHGYILLTYPRQIPLDGCTRSNFKILIM